MVYDYCNTVYLTFVPLCVIKRFLDTFYGSTALVSQDILVVEVQRSTQTLHTRYDSSGRGIGPSQTSDNAQHSKRDRIHAPGGIRTYNPSKRTAADPRLRPRDHCDRHFSSLIMGNFHR